MGVEMCVSRCGGRKVVRSGRGKGKIRKQKSKKKQD